MTILYTVYMQPMRDIVLIKADEAPEKTKSGLLLGEQWKTLPLTGTVLKVGPDVKDIYMGEKVFFCRYASIILENDERLIKARQVIGKVNG